MTAFITNDTVRLKFQLEEASGISEELIAVGIENAHADILSRIQDCYAAAPPEPVVTAETLLAGAALLRSLTARMALERRETRLAGQQLDTGKRLPALLEVASAAESEADRLLQPYLRHDARPETPLLLTDGAE